MKDIDSSAHLSQEYKSFLSQIQTALPSDNIITDPLRTLAYGTDASFYRLIPKLVIKARHEQDVALLLTTASQYGLPVTFRAAGTSLSGQAISDSILIIAGNFWRGRQVLDDGERIRLQPGVIGGHANNSLRSYGKKIGPDPASINAAMIGGIAANNASGMCCGTAQNSYKTLASMRLVLGDGTILDSEDGISRMSFKQKNSDIYQAIGNLRDEVRSNPELSERIRQKFKIKNTTGYSLNALIDFDDPIDIITHLMIGSEGTLGFISEITYNTVDEYVHKASGLILFSSIEEACSSVPRLREQPVAAVELMDRAALRSVEMKAGMPDYLQQLPEEAAALLVETRAPEQAILHSNMDSIMEVLSNFSLLRPASFTEKASEYTKLWNIRKGLFPAVGAVRESGTTVIIEDVAFPIEHLAAATVQLQKILQSHHYDNAIIFGHALEGNLHFVFTQDFGTTEEIARYDSLMQQVCTMVVDSYQGSLKAEHGTGRNMAPFVEYEWGHEAYVLMQRIKKIFDPRGLLNPGVILNTNPQAHLENLKPLASTHPLIDKCIECGFCEPECPSRNLTLTPRQRITVQREISRLKALGNSTEQVEQLLRGYTYQGDQTCATDGLCQTACPVEINTGDMTKELRRMQVAGTGKETLARIVARHFGLVTTMVRMALRGVDLLHQVLGTSTMQKLSIKARNWSDNKLPLWTLDMPTGAKGKTFTSFQTASERKVVYFPSCISRTMGPSRRDNDRRQLFEVTEAVLKRAGFSIFYPDNMAKLCCGVPFQSKGAFRQADEKAAQLERVLLETSENGKIPILCDTSPCLYRMREVMDKRLSLYEPAEFFHDFVIQHLQIDQLKETVALHTTCSSQKMGLADKLLQLARQCAEKVVVPENVGCCGFAGDRGFTYPELNEAALADLQPEIFQSGATSGYSNSRTCEIGLSTHSGICYHSIVHLVERCSREDGKVH